MPSLSQFRAYRPHYRRYLATLKTLGDRPLEHFCRVRGLEPCLAVERKTFFPDMCHKIQTRTIVVNRRRRYAKTVEFGDFRVHLERHCTVSFGEDLQLFYSLRREPRNALDLCLETHSALESSQSAETQAKARRTLKFELLWKRRLKLKVTGGLDLYQETVRALPKLLSKSKQEVGRAFLYQGGVVVFYSDLSK